MKPGCAPDHFTQTILLQVAAHNPEQSNPIFPKQFPAKFQPPLNATGARTRRHLVSCNPAAPEKKNARGG
jgi:hypothetical protein